MGTRWAGTTIYGNKLYQERARRALPILVRQAKARQPITYSDLAKELGMANPRNLNFVLGSVGETLKALSRKWNEEIPLINMLVINKMTGRPGTGIGLFVGGQEAFEKLPLRIQTAIVEGELRKIYGYKKWNEVMNSLGFWNA